MPRKLTWKKVGPKDKERLAQLYSAGVPLDADAEALGMKRSSLEREIRQYIFYKKELLGSAAADIQFEEMPRKRYTDFLSIPTDEAIIVSDIEVPDHDPLYLKLALLSGMRLGVKRLIVAGDFIATDQDALNSWVTTWRRGDETRYEEDVDMAVSILSEFAKWFTDITIIEGNHDDRLNRKTSGEVHLGMFLRGTNALYSRYAYLHLHTSRGLVWVVHPDNFSGDPITLGQQLYNVHSPKGHWVLGHCHRRQDGWTPDGEYEVHALGCGREEKKTKYKATKINKHKQWDKSFLAIQDGFHVPLDLKATNWREFLGELCPKGL